MGIFHICIDDDPVEIEGDSVVAGVLQIDEFKENFHASLSYWGRGDYLSQWMDGLNRLLCGEKKSAVVTSMYDPNVANFIFWWVIYLVEDIVYIQNHVLFLDELGRPFEEANLYDFIPDRETQTDEGVKISEWKVDILAIRVFVARGEIGFGSQI